MDTMVTALGLIIGNTYYTDEIGEKEKHINCVLNFDF